MKNLSDFLLEHDLVTRETLARGEEIAREGHIRLPAALTRLGLLSEKELADAMSELLGVQTLKRNELLSLGVLPSELNAAYLKLKRVIPLSLSESSAELAMADPLDEATLTAMGFALGLSLIHI